MKRALPARRMLGSVFLFIAMFQVGLGLTLLQDRLSAVGTLVYWTVCLLATFGAILCALLDALRNLGASRRERRALLENTLREIDEERVRRRAASGNQSPESH